MPKKDRARIDYMPGSAALEALGQAGAMFPNLRTQALIDKLVITGLCALHWKAPLSKATKCDEAGKVTAHHQKRYICRAQPRHQSQRHKAGQLFPKGQRKPKHWKRGRQGLKLKLGAGGISG